MPALRPRDSAKRAQTSIRTDEPAPAPKKTASKVTKKKPAKSAKSTAAAAATSTSAAASRASAASSSGPVAVGDKVPQEILKKPLTRDRTAVDSALKTSLAQELKNSDVDGLIVFVFPKAFTDEASDFASEFESRMVDYEEVTSRSMLGLSPDSKTRNTKFEMQQEMRLRVLSDERCNVLRPLGISITKGSKPNQGAAFALDKDGTLSVLRVGTMEAALEKFNDDMWKLELTKLEREEGGDVLVI